MLSHLVVQVRIPHSDSLSRQLSKSLVRVIRPFGLTSQLTTRAWARSERRVRLYIHPNFYYLQDDLFRESFPPRSVAGQFE